jgi:prepilin-type N-terminal cleavage/methylation domain-containing protein
MKYKIKKAFSLIELSIVVLIISILISGGLTFSTVSIIKKRTELTEEKFEKIYKALGVYLSTNGKLPCPAPLNDVKSDSNYGVAAATCSSAPASGSGYYQSNDSTDSPNVYYGMIPVKTLNLPIEYGEDGFGTKLSYMVVNGLTDSDSFGKGSDSLENYANSVDVDRIIVQEKHGSTTHQITNDAAFAIISYGPNKAGGWNDNSTSQNSVSTDDEEAENSVSSPDGSAGQATFDNEIFFASPDSDVFDDLVFYKTRDQITFDFNLLSLVSCDEDFAGSAPNYGGYSSFTWNADPNTKYGELKAADSGTCSAASYSEGVAAPTKRCGPFGKWEGDIIDNCIQ